MTHFSPLPPDTPGPFSTVLSSYYNNGITPIVGGAFGECSEHVDPLLQHCALHAAATKAGLILTPDTDTTCLLSTRNILLHEFRMTIGASILRANIRTKLTRVPFICPSPQYALVTAAQYHSKRHNAFHQDTHSWFTNTGDTWGVYDTYYKYRELKQHFGDLSPYSDADFGIT